MLVKSKTNNMVPRVSSQGSEVVIPSSASQHRSDDSVAKSLSSRKAEVKSDHKTHEAESVYSTTLIPDDDAKAILER